MILEVPPDNDMVCGNCLDRYCKQCLYTVLDGNIYDKDVLGVYVTELRELIEKLNRC